jgi:hypothetical protein
VRAGTSMRCARALPGPAGARGARATPCKRSGDLAAPGRALGLAPSSRAPHHGPPGRGRSRRARPCPAVTASLPPSDALPPSATPPEATPALPQQPPHAQDWCCLRRTPARPASGQTRGCGAAVPRPARSPADASHIVFPSTAPGGRPALAGSPVAGQDVHPLDDARRCMVASHPPVPFDPQGLVALKFLYSCCASLSQAAAACWGRWQAHRAFSGVELRKGRR